MSEYPNGMEPEPIQTVTESGAPVKSRISSVQAAREVFRKLCENDEQDAMRRARLRGHVNGNPPYDPVRLEELGLGYSTNTNFLEMRSILDAKAGQAYELFFEVPSVVDVRISPLALPLMDKQAPLPDYGMVVAEEFSKMLLAWPGFLSNMDLSRRECDLVGIGVQLFRDEWDWRPKAFNSGSFKYPASASLDPDSWPLCAFKDSMSVADLVAQVLDNEMAEEAGWNREVVKSVIKRGYIQAEGTGQNWQEKYRTTPWEEVEQRIRNKDWTTELAALEDVQVVHMLVTELDSKEVSHLLFAEPNGNTSDPGPNEDTFMFRKDRRYKQMSSAVWVLPYNNAGGTLRSCRGLASLLEPHCDLSNRFLGRVFDAGFTMSSLLLQPKTAMDMSKLQLIRAGMVTVIPAGVEAVQSSFQPSISPLIQLRDLSSAIMQNNSGQRRTAPETFGENQGEKTARQVVEEVAKEARAEKANTAFEYAHIERLYREMFARATNPAYLQAETKLPGREEALSFIRRCLLRGVPERLLLTPGAFELSATRAIGMGSWGVKLDITNQVLNARSLFDEHGQVAAIREWLAVRVGYQNVDRFKPLVNRDTIPSNEMSVATLENNSFANGQPVPVGSDQFHAIHLAIHGSMIDGFAEVVQQGAQNAGSVDITKIATALSNLLPHFQSHLQYVAQDPARKPMVDEGVKRLKLGAQLMQFAQQVAQQRANQMAAAKQEQMAAAQEQGAQQMSETMQLKMAEMDREFALKSEKLKSLNDMRAEKTAENLRLQRERTAADIQLKGQRLNADIQLDQLKTQADIATKVAKASVAQPSRPAT